MIDRSYLPFQSAREHQDRGIEKWTGFFLSEHTSSLIKDKRKKTLSSNLEDTEKQTLIGQLYTNRLTGIFTVNDKQSCRTLTGQVAEVSSHFVTIKNNRRHYTVRYQDILAVNLWKSQ